MADLARCRRIVAGTLPPGVDAAPLNDDERRAVVRRAWLAQWQRARPLPPPLDRLSPEALVAFRARTRS